MHDNELEEGELTDYDAQSNHNNNDLDLNQSDHDHDHNYELPTDFINYYIHKNTQPSPNHIQLTHIPIQHTIPLHSPSPSPSPAIKYDRFGRIKR